MRRAASRSRLFRRAVADARTPTRPSRRPRVRTATVANAGEPAAAAARSPLAGTRGGPPHAAGGARGVRRLYINWNYRTLTRQQQTLAAMSVGAARLAEQQAAASSRSDGRSAAGRIYNHGHDRRAAPRQATACGWSSPASRRAATASTKGCRPATTSRSPASRSEGDGPSANGCHRTDGPGGERPPRWPWAAMYAAIWTITLAAAVVAAIGTATTAFTIRLLGLMLTPPARRSQPLGGSWGWRLTTSRSPHGRCCSATRARATGRAPDASRTSSWAASLLANVLPVGAAIGAYGGALVAYIPQLPLEWAGLAVGYAAWVAQRGRPVGVRERTGWLAVITVLMVGAAMLETLAVPHR